MATEVMFCVLLLKKSAAIGKGFMGDELLSHSIDSYLGFL